jgi:hypothetical protein
MVRIETVGQNGTVPETFLALPDALYAGQPCWTPRPVENTVRLLDTAYSPYWKQAERELFVATRDGKVVGRIVATDDSRMSRDGGDNSGYFGFFECIDDQAVADALLVAAGDWLRQRGRLTMRGPFCPSPYIYDLGLLIEGFDQPQAIGEPYNPPYYQRLLETHGLVKSVDELSLDMPGRAPEGTLKNAVRRRIAARPELRVRPFDTSRIESELRIAADILNAEYGSDPIYSADSFDVARFALESLFPFGDWGLCLLAEIDGEPAGIMINAPDCDAGWRLRAARGDAASPDTAYAPTGSCVVELAIAPKFQHTHVGPALFYAFWDAVGKRDYTYNRACFVDEDNHGCLSLIAAFGGRIARRYRVYQTELAAAG